MTTALFWTYLLIPVGAGISALAQIMLKRTSALSNWSRGWFLLLFASAALYGVSFFIYLYLLKLHPISKIYPLLTILVIMIITIYGYLHGEYISIKHGIGIGLGAASIYMLLSG